jgi:alkylated DNA repair dioxygenase AlkB
MNLSQQQRAFDAAALINLDLYPLNDLNTHAGRAVIAEGRAQLARNGLCLMPDLLAPAALAAMVREARELAPRAYHATSWITGTDLRNENPVHRPTRNACGSIPYDLLAASSPIRQLYEWDGLVALFRELLGVEHWYRCADPISSCLLMYYGDGEELGWHCDSNDGVVTLLLQAAETGGGFEFVPGVGRTDLRFEQVLDGVREGVVAAPLRPGTLSLFRGTNSMHRVTRVSGRQERIMLAMSFHERPGYMFSPENRRRYSGRDA